MTKRNDCGTVSPKIMMLDVLLFIFIGVSLYTDIARRKVFNCITFPAMVLGLGFNMYYSGLPGVRESLLGIVAGFLFLIAIYVLGGMGAGDVKFLMTVGSIKGYNFALMGGLYGAVLGGIVAMGVLIYQRKAVSTLKEIATGMYLFAITRKKESLRFGNEKSFRLPYTVFLSAGIVLRCLLEG